MKLSNKKLGNSFEESFELSAKYSGWTVIKIPDGCKRINHKQTILVKCPFDFVFAKNGLAVFCDAKTTEGKTFPQSKINKNQLEKLLSLHDQKMIAGYVVYFRETRTVRFFSAKEMSEVKPGDSLKEEKGILLGGIGNIDLGKIRASEPIGVNSEAQ